MKKQIAALLVIITIIMSPIFVSAMEIQEQATPSGISLKNLETFVDGYVAEYVGRTSPGLAVVVVKDGKILLSRGYGFADIENKVTVDPAETVFEYGSVSKLFVYTTIMRLVEEGKIDLEADIRTYLPDGFLRKLRYDDPITLLNVMNHTTGFEDYLFDVVVTTNTRQSFEKTLHTGQPEQVYRPGTVSAYSNYAVALAAYIVQEMVGQDFYEYLADNIFLPLGMVQTSAHPELKDKPWLEQDKAAGYSPISDGEFNKGSWSYIPLYPVGSVNGTAEDLARFAIALMPDTGEKSMLFEDQDTLDTMFSQSLEMGPGMTGFAHGFIEFDGYRRGVGHGGNTAYFTAQVNIVPEERFGVIILANAANEIDLTQGLTKALLGDNPEELPPDVGNLPDASSVEGDYISARRAHNGFLKLYAYLSLLKVESIDNRTIEMRFAGQSAEYTQIEPYVFRQVKTSGSFFENNFRMVYFAMEDGKVQKVSGDFLPLPSGHTVPWLLADGVIAAVSMSFYLFTPIVFLVIALIRRKKKTKIPATVRRSRKSLTLFVFSGTALLINNALMVARMLANNYRSFSEVRPHIILNYPIIFIAAATGIAALVFGQKAKMAKKYWRLYAASVLSLLAVVYVLFKWQFFNMLI